MIRIVMSRDGTDMLKQQVVGFKEHISSKERGCHSVKTDVADLEITQRNNKSGPKDHETLYRPKGKQG